MKRKLFLTVCLALILLISAACSSGTTITSTGQVPQITVTGSGKVYVSPDLAYINVGVRSQGDTVSEALDLNNSQATAIKDTLVAQGVAETDIQTSGLYVYPQTDYNSSGVGTQTYYSVENSVYVTVRDLDKLGTILDAVAKSGANSIYGIDFNVQDDSAAKTSARLLAIESAQAQAAELAEATGVELGDIMAISSTYSSATSYYGYGMGGGGGADYATTESVPIASGQIQVGAEVTISYTIK